MKTRIFKSVMLACITATFYSFDLPSGWFKAGSHPKNYDMGIEKGAGQNGNNAATIKSNSKKINGFGKLMQNCLPDKYLGRRISMTEIVDNSVPTTDNSKNTIPLSEPSNLDFEN